MEEVCGRNRSISTRPFLKRHARIVTDDLLPQGTGGKLEGAGRIDEREAYEASRLIWAFSG
ncbi:MAG: hypothetical protein GX110_03215 [Synergistaceae bacterium]|nr:hypothetical protein [Synergistaceae bacterium]